jgi:L,D-transpeptidase YbiS
LAQIEVSLSQQKLFVRDTNSGQTKVYPISTAKNGPGCQKDSGCTPIGKHIIRAKIGQNAPMNAVFVGRRWEPKKEICTPELMAKNPDRDWILTRILWLSGKELGVNRLGDVDTMQRYIYIHGTPDSVSLNRPNSHGCIRMRNTDVIDLFDRVSVGDEVDILR